jgi:hypothetical protein
VLNYNGQLTGQTGIHYRWEHDLFVRYQKQLTIAPGPLKPISSERDFIFETLLAGTQLADDVLAADKEAIGNREVYDDQYFETLYARTRPILERRLNEAISAVASVIANAWERAGRPALPAQAPPQPPQRRRTGQPAKP